jgi:lysophospholipase L1-like esterase
MTPQIAPVPPTLYIALGDSISIDVYPAADAARRHPGKASSDRLGAASLFYRNDDRLWPEFRGRDLSTLHDEIEFDDLTADGATTPSLLLQVDRIRKSEEETLITITIGGNDLLGMIGSGGGISEIKERVRVAVKRVLELRPKSAVIITTVYDPTDGTNRLPGYSGKLEQEAKWLREYNDFLRDLVRTDSRFRLADIHPHFLGHGLTAPENEQWYLLESIIEPNARGASEVRRVWLGAMG